MIKNHFNHIKSQWAKNKTFQNIKTSSKQQMKKSSRSPKILNYQDFPTTESHLKYKNSV